MTALNETSNLYQKLKNGEFVITAELSPPKVPDLSSTGPGGTRVTAKLIVNHAEFQAWNRAFLTRNVNAISGQLLLTAKAMAPVKTGRLRNAIKPSPTRFTGASKVEGGIEIDKAEVPYAGYVRWGTRPHVIRARRAKALRFEIQGREIFAKSVHHPGTKPNYFMERAVSKVAQSLR